MGDELGKHVEDSNNRRGAWADINLDLGAQMKKNFGVMDGVPNIVGNDIIQAFNVLPPTNTVWNTALNRAYGGAWELMKPISPFKDVQDIMGARVTGVMDVMKPLSVTNVFGASAKSNWLGASAVIDFSMKSMIESQQLFANAFAANIGAAGLAKTFNFNVLQGLSKHVEFKNMMASAQWTTKVEEPLREYLEDDPFPEIQELVEELGIEELDEEQQAVADEILEARPEIAAIVTSSPGYSLLSPQQRVLVLGIVTIAVWCIVVLGVVYVEAEVPWLRALLEDIELTPTEAANKASAAVGTTGTLSEIVRLMTSAREPEVQPDN